MVGVLIACLRFVSIIGRWTFGGEGGGGVEGSWQRRERESGIQISSIAARMESRVFAFQSRAKDV